MAYSADTAAIQVQDRLKSLYGLVHEIQASREKSEHNLNNITKTQERINQDDRVSNYHQVLQVLSVGDFFLNLLYEYFIIILLS